MNITNRTTHNVQQGTGAWLRLRAGFNTASEAPAALGVSRYVSRSELLRQKHTGLPPEHSAATLGKFAAGHAAEDKGRPLAEELAGGDLFPVTMTANVDGMDLLSSLDGLTLDGEIAWETKLWNEDLAAAVRLCQLPEHYTVQMDQELLVSGATRCLFTCTDGTPERFVSCWYEPTPERFAALLAGWRQFQADLAAFVMPTAAPAQPEGKAPETLPALHIEVTGKVTASNLAEFKQTALAAIQSVNRELKTDQDFADAAKAVKWCSEIEERLQAAKQHALSQTASIDTLFRTMDEIGAEAKRVRLELDKLVTRRKTEVKEEAVFAARRALAAHYDALNAELAPARLPTPAVDFPGAIKGLRSFDSMQSALDTLVAKSKIEADAQARTIRTNRAAMDAAEAGHLFPDFAQVCTKPTDDFANLIISRRAAAQARIEAERERIRAEEVARLEREQREEAERQARELAAARVRAEAAEAAATKAPTPVAEARTATEPLPAPAPEVRAFYPAAAVRNEQPTMTLGQLGTRLGFNPTADFLASLGFEAHKDRASRLYRPSDFPSICKAISAHVMALAVEKQAA